MTQPKTMTQEKDEIQPLVSIITVTFNAGEVIGKTMKSLEEQSYRDF